MMRRFTGRRPRQSARYSTRIVGIALVLVGVLIAGMVSAQRVAAADPILGSGSTFAEVALDAWAADIYGSDGLGVTFSGIGSKGGLNQFQQGVVDFASSDVPYPETEATPRAYAYVPIVAGGTAIMYNLVDGAGKRIENLRLSPQTIADIFFGNIDNWNHETIRAENPDLLNRLPEIEIKLAVRTSGSGTTGVFTDFLSSTAPAAWNEFVQRADVVTQAGGNYTTDWPASSQSFNCRCAAYAGSSEIANVMAQNTPGARGSIGYAETAYAILLSLPVVAVKNAAGNYRLPDAKNVAIALLAATENGDGTQNLEGVFVSQRPEAYPASSYNYLVVPTEDLSAGKGETLGRYLIYSVTEGQAEAEDLGYSPLPPNLVQFALNRVPLIEGAPEPPPLGDWGRYYEDLDTDVVTTVPPTAPPTTPPPVGGTNTTAPPAGGTNTTAPPAGGTNTTAPPAGGTDTTAPPAGGTNTTSPTGAAGATPTTARSTGTTAPGSTATTTVGSASTLPGSAPTATSVVCAPDGGPMPTTTSTATADATSTTIAGAASTTPGSETTTTSTTTVGAARSFFGSATASTTTTTSTSTSTSGVAGSDTTTTTPDTTTTTTVVECVPEVAGSNEPTATSITPDGQVVVVASPGAVGEGSSALGGSDGVPLSPGLRFDGDDLVSRDGRKVPEVEAIGIAPLLGVSAIVAGLVLVPPLLFGGGVFTRRGHRRGVAGL